MKKTPFGATQGDKVAEIKSKKSEIGSEKAEKKYNFPLKQKGGIYFHSGAIIGRKNVFVTKEYLDLLANAIKLAELKQDIKNLAYVIMPNYFYWLFKLPQNQDDPVAIYGEAKKKVAFEIMANLKREIKQGTYQMLELFKNNDRIGRSKPEKLLWSFEEQAKNFEANKKFKIWAPKTGLCLIENDEMLQTKLTTIKNAPISDRWKMVEKSEDYPYLYLAEEMPGNDAFDCLQGFPLSLDQRQAAAIAS